MAYEPFALKYRPRVFTDLVGQEAVATTLRNALRSGRIANAFLFCGSRGTGKTSMARILAKALNCPEAKDGEPCGGCEICSSIARGEDIDVIEIDGASNRGIDEIRAIRDNVGYAPSRSRFKIYIIDEVHMLTIQAFNALLKTLEEPPPHVRFVFATTEASAVPETIVSRCQRYEFKRIGVPDIVRRLGDICTAEGIAAGEEVLREIAVRAEGGLRDSTSLLDQAVAFAGATIRMEDLDRVLGLIDGRLLEGLLSPLGQGDLGQVLDALDEAFESGRDAEDVLSQVLEVFRAAMVRTARGERGGGDGRRAALVALVRESFGLERLLLAIRLLLNARRDMKSIGLGRLQLELAFLKIARSADLAPLREILDRLGDAPLPGATARPSAPPPSSPTPPRFPRNPPPEARDDDDGPPLRAVPSSRGGEAPPARTIARPPEARTAPISPAASGTSAAAPKATPAPHAPIVLEVVRAEWPRVLKAVRDAKPRTAALLDQATPERLDASGLLVRLPAGSDFAKGQLEGGQRRILEEALGQVLGQPLGTSYVVTTGAPKAAEEKPAARRAYEDPGVRKILETFNGGVVSIEPEKSPGPKGDAAIKSKEAP